MEVIEEKYLEKWEDFTDLFNNYEADSKKYIFRGHSNKVISPNGFQKWSLISSFNRIKGKSGYSFSDYLFQQLQSDFFEITYSNYLYEKIDMLTNASVLQKCYFFQHYGIATCFIDFTFDPLVALYFSLTAIPGRSGGCYDGNGNPKFYSNDQDKDFISIYQIDVQLLQEILNIKPINPDNFGFPNIDEYIISATKFSSIDSYLGLDLNPLQGEQSINNFNLKNQKGCFLYYDNEEFNGSFEKFVNLFCLEHNIKLKSSIIKIYNINYNSLFKKRRENHPTHVSVFNFLRHRKITGQFLFDDMQGLKYDFNFFHQD